MNDLRRRGRNVRILRIVGLYLALSIAAAAIVFPVYVTVVNSTLSYGDILNTRVIPPNPFRAATWTTIAHSYSAAWSDGTMGRYLFNSAIMTVCIVVGQVMTGVLAGYAFAYLRFPLKRVLFFLFLATLMIPFEVTLLSNLKFISSLGLYDTYAALCLPFLATGFGAFLMRQAFLGVPNDLWDAAQLDGYGHLRFLWKVALPIVRPSVAALTVFGALSAWGQYLWPQLAASGRPEHDLRTVQIGVGVLVQQNATSINVAYAGLVLAMVPIVIVLIIFQKQLIRGLTAGAVKG
ncbi:MAG: carbohydrate ABC transporter permease [Acidimicrobiia bacterium]